MNFKANKELFSSGTFSIQALSEFSNLVRTMPAEFENGTKILRLDPVYTVPDPHGHDIKLNSFKTSVALKSMIILQNLITTNHRKSGKSKDDLKLTELDVVTM